MNCRENGYMFTPHPTGGWSLRRDWREGRREGRMGKREGCDCNYEVGA